MFGLKNDEMLTCFLLIIVGYTLAKMFSRRCEGFSVGADDFAQSCDPNSRNKGDYYCQTRVGSGTSCNQTCMNGIVSFQFIALVKNMDIIVIKFIYLKDICNSLFIK